MTPEERRAEIDCKFRFQVELPHHADDWNAARETMDFLMTFIGTFDMYALTHGGQSWVRYCFMCSVDAELFRTFANKDKTDPSGVSKKPRPMGGKYGERYPHHVDVPRRIDEDEGDRLADYVLAHIGWFLSYEVTEGGIVHTRFRFETAEHAELFRGYLGRQVGSRSAA